MNSSCKNHSPYSFLRLFTILLCLLYSIPTHTLPSHISFQNKLNDGAPGEIKAILQDKRGFMWLGGRNAILKYDGYEFKSMHFIEDIGGVKKKINPYYITSILEDDQGVVWFSSHSGLLQYDADHDILRKIKAPTDTVKLTSSALDVGLQDVDLLPDGKLIVTYSGGLSIIDRELFLEKRFFHIVNDPTSLSHNRVEKVVVDQQGRVWVSTQNGLNRFDYKSGKFTHFIPFPEDPQSEIDNFLVNLIVDHQGNLWGGTRGGGLYKFNPETEKFTRYRHSPDVPHSLAEDSIWKLYVDSFNTLWIAYDRKGFAHYDPENDQFANVYYPEGGHGAPANNYIRSIYEDRNGDIWMGHYPSEVSFHDKSSAAITAYRPSKHIPNGISGSNILAIMEDLKENLWVVEGGTINYLDRKTNEIKYYNQANQNYQSSGTLTGYLDHAQRPWIGTWTEGFHRYNPEQDVFLPMPANAKLASKEVHEGNSLNDETIWTFCETSDGYFWIGTHNGGISRYDKKKNHYQHFKNFGSRNLITNNIAWSCFEDSKNRFWVGTAYGLNLMENLSKIEFKKFFPQEGTPHQLQSGSVLDIYEDEQNRLWFATNAGLHLYREETGDFIIYSKEHGFNDHGIRAITGDEQGYLWLGTNDGIIRFHPDTREVKNFIKHSGQKIGGINTGAVERTKRGEIVFGGVNGLYLIDTNKLSKNTTPPLIVFTDFKIFAKSVPIDSSSDSILTKSINETQRIILDHRQKMFSIEFAALNFRDSKNNQYAYKLQGFDEEWRDIGNQREAQYTNLSAGKYIFHVRASNNDGVWNDDGRSVEIIQLPPPWKTWWAYTLYALISLGIITHFIQTQKRKRRLVEEQNRLLEIKVAERTADLAEKNRDIEAMLSSMKQGLFAIEENGNIHSEYSTYLKDIFEIDNIAGLNAFNFLFENADLNNDISSQIEASLASIIGTDEMNFSFNQHLLPTEYSKIIHEKSKVLSLQWDPIIVNDSVEKLMVTVRDVTALKALEQSAGEQKRELDIISQLLKVNTKKFKNYYESAKQYLKEATELVEQNDQYNENAIAILFRNMHTIKGNSRTFGFTYLANRAHDAESVYSGLKSHTVKWDKQALLIDLATVEASLEEYHHVHANVLGRDNNSPHEKDGLWLSQPILNQLYDNINSIEASSPSTHANILRLLALSETSSIEEILSDNLKALPSIADELAKPAPNIQIQDNQIRVKEDLENLLRDVFSHVLRNSLDHGIEPPDERSSKGKAPEGTIRIILKSTKDHIAIIVADDGRGLNIERLYNKGLETNRWSADNFPSYTKISDFIFESGISTKENVSSISGRGVGMDAVKQFLKKSGGDIQIKTNTTSQMYNPNECEPFIDFETHILLPKTHFVVDS